MPIGYKINVLKALKEAGYSTYRIQQEKLLGGATIQKLKNGNPVSFDSVSMICELLDLQPGDILEYVNEKQPKKEVSEGNLIDKELSKKEIEVIVKKKLAERQQV